MGLTIAQKIIKEHLVSGDMIPGSEIALKIDQTLTQDATGTMAYLEFETMGVPRVRTELSVAYIDHNTQTTIDLSSLWLKNTDFTFQDRATEYATRYTWSVSESRGKL